MDSFELDSSIEFSVLPLNMRQVLEQLVILFLHCVIMAGMSFQLELANDFWPELHCTWNKEVTETLSRCLDLT